LKARSFEGKGRFSNWVYKVAFHEALRLIVEVKKEVEYNAISIRQKLTDNESLTGWYVTEDSLTSTSPISDENSQRIADGRLREMEVLLKEKVEQLMNILPEKFRIFAREYFFERKYPNTNQAAKAHKLNNQDFQRWFNKRCNKPIRQELKLLFDEINQLKNELSAD